MLDFCIFGIKLQEFQITQRNIFPVVEEWEKADTWAAATSAGIFWGRSGALTPGRAQPPAEVLSWHGSRATSSLLEKHRKALHSALIFEGSKEDQLATS